MTAMPPQQVEALIERAMEQSGLGQLNELSPIADVSAALEALSTWAGRLPEVGRILLRQEAVSHVQSAKIRCTAAAIDAALKSGQAGAAATTAPPIDTVEPWPEPVDQTALLDSLCQTIRAHVALAPAEADAIALWTLHTHALDAAAISPRLAILSPTKRCGKTTLLKVLNGLAFRPLAASSVSVAAIFRVMDAAKPTLLIDEADTFLRHNEELRGVLNAGHDRSMARVLRCSGHDSDVTVHAFDAWGPVAIAAIGHIPGTLVDRSIVIRLRRKQRSDTIQRFRRRERERLVPLQRKCVRWAIDAVSALRSQQVPEVPVSNDRAADNWEPLVAIASLAGDGWTDRALAAAETLTRASEGDDSSRQISEQLLSHVGELFAEGAVGSRIPMEALCSALSAIQGAPWATHSDGKPINTAQLGRYLRTFRIAPKTIRFPDGPAKGYERAQFADAFARYLEPSVTSVTGTDSQANHPVLGELQEAPVTGPRSPKNASGHAAVTDVTTDGRQVPFAFTEGSLLGPVPARPRRRG